MGIRQRLKEALFPSKGTVVLSTVEQSYGKRLTTSFKDQLSVFNKDPVTKQSVVRIAQEVISTGIFTAINEDYKAALPTGPDGLKWTAKECLDYWNKEVNLDAKILQVAIEIVAFGNSLWHTQNGGLDNIPIQAIRRADPRTKKIPIQKEYNLRLTHAYGAKVLRYDSFIHFRTNITGNAPFGSGIVEGLVAKPNNTTPSLWEMILSTRKFMDEGFRKFSFGNVYISFEGMPDDKIEEYNKKVQSMKSTGERLLTNVKTDVKLDLPERTQSYDKWIEQTYKEYYYVTSGGITPETQYTTKATAQAVREAFKMRINSIRRIIKREIETLWIGVLNGYGFDGEKANARLQFASEDVDYKVEDIYRAYELKIITIEEARKRLRDDMKWPLEDKLPEVVEEVPAPLVAKESTVAPLVIPAPNVIVNMPHPTKTKTTKTLKESKDGVVETETKEIEYDGSSDLQKD